MKVVILHKKTKRQIEGPFSICCSRADFEQIKNKIDEWLKSGAVYGWLDIDEVQEYENTIKTTRQKPLVNSEPLTWD